MDPVRASSRISFGVRLGGADADAINADEERAPLRSGGGGGGGTTMAAPALSVRPLCCCCCCALPLTKPLVGWPYTSAAAAAAATKLLPWVATPDTGPSAYPPDTEPRCCDWRALAPCSTVAGAAPEVAAAEAVVAGPAPSVHTYPSGSRTRCRTRTMPRTRFGSRVSVSLPWPRRPWLPLPHVQSAPGL